MVAMVLYFRPMPPYVPSPADDPPQRNHSEPEIEWRNRKESEIVSFESQSELPLIWPLVVYHHISPYWDQTHSYMQTIRRQPEAQRAVLVADMEASAMSFIREHISGKIPYPVKPGNSIISTYKGSRDPKWKCETFFRKIFETAQIAREETRDSIPGDLQ